MFWVLCFGFVLGFVFCVLGFVFCVLGFVFCVLGFVFCVLGFGFCSQTFLGGALGEAPGRPLTEAPGLKAPGKVFWRFLGGS